MSQEEVLGRRMAVSSPLSLIGWVMLGLLVGAAFTLTGVAGIFVAAALAMLVVFGALAAKFPTFAMTGCIWWLALCPFGWGIQTALFRVGVDESPLLLYLAAFPFLYLFAARSWRHGFSGLYFALGIFVCGQALTLAGRSDLLATRTFLDTSLLGALLLVLYLQESSNSSAEEVGRGIVWLTVLLAVLTLVERLVQRNPFIERPDFNYPLIVRLTHGVYRPHVTFENPSETGTYMAFGVPFVLRSWVRRRSWLATLAVGIVGAAILVNATRGVWFGLLVAGLVALLAVRHAWLWLLTAIPLAGAGAAVGYFTFRTTAFVQRLTNLTDLYDRFQSWALAWKVFLAHPLLGVGIGNFPKTNVPDNMFVSAMAEGGLVGLAALFAFLLASLFLLRRFRRKLEVEGLTARASFVRCAELALLIYMGAGCLADVQGFRKPDKFLFMVVGIGLAEGLREVARSSPQESAAVEKKVSQVV